MRRVLSLAVFGGLVVFPLLPAYGAPSAMAAMAALADADGDLIDDELDVCPTVADPFQGDIDGDGIGDLCDDATTGVTSFAGTPLDDVVVGTDEADTLSGAGGADALYGEDGDDELDGGDGRDFLSGGPGTDTLTGGASCDTFAFDPNGDGDIITDFDPEVDRLRFPAQDEGSSDDAAPQATFGGDDFLVVTFLVDNEPVGTLDLQGLDPGVEVALDASPCESIVIDPPVIDPPVIDPPVDPPPLVCTPLFDEDVVGGDVFGIEIPLDGVFINGTSESETLYGTNCSDFISGDGGFTVEGTEPAASDPESCVTGVCSGDDIYGSAGNDLLIGDVPILLESDIGGNDSLFGGHGDDLLIGDGSQIGYAPVDQSGFEMYCEGDCGPTAMGGDDLIFGESGNDFLIGDAIFIDVNGAGGDDLLSGGDGDDVIIGDALALDGFGGDDVLIGGAGDDDLFGDAIELFEGLAGSDTFVFDTTSDFGDDVIHDLGASEVYDTIQFRGPGLNTTADLDARSTVADDGSDVLAVVYTTTAKTTEVGSVRIVNAGGAGIASWQDLDDLWPVDVVVVP